MALDYNSVINTPKIVTKIFAFAFSMLFVGILFLSATPASASFCRCANPNGTSCRVDQTDTLHKDGNGNPTPLSCVTCSVFCQDNKLAFNSCQENATDANQPWSKGGCGQMYCWCKTDKNTCENHTADGNNKVFLDTPSCDAYCTSRNWTAIHYDDTYIDWNQKTQAQQGCSDLGGANSSPGMCVCDNGSCQATDPKSGTCPANCKPGNCNQSATTQKPADNTTNQSPTQINANDLQAHAYRSLNKLPIQVTGVAGIIGLVVKTLFGFIGSVTLALYIYAGFLWMTSMGSSEKTEQARTIFVWTSLGVVVMLSSYIIVDLLFTSFGIK